MKEKNRFYITTPIYYVNAEPHIGHAYTQITADVLARYHRMLGEDVFFLTGTDEHGNKIERASRDAGFGPGEEKKFVDGIVERFKAAWQKLDIEYDHFIRTTDPEHKSRVQDLLMKMKDRGDIYSGEYDGCYCTPCETFWTEKEASGGFCPECERPLEEIKEKNYFFRMSKYQNWLLEHLKKDPEFCMPEFRKNEVTGFLKEELNDLCISRPKSRMSWGIELPFDDEYVVYVWFDALINYLTGITASGRDLEEVWPADIHLIAKDILRHHAVYWPIMLKSAGYEMPGTVFAHGWWKMGDEKMSKSKGNIVDPLELTEEYGVDPVRYFLLKAISLGSDGLYTDEFMRTLYNNDLANDLGNLLNRTLTMVEKYFGSVAPEVPEISDDEQLKRSVVIKEALIPLSKKVHDKLTSPELQIKEALDEVLEVIDKANKYIERSAPWEYSKKGRTDVLKLIMMDLLEVLREVCVILSPVMPESMNEMWHQLGYEGNAADGFDASELSRKKTETDWRKVKPGLKVKKGKILFPRM